MNNNIYVIGHKHPDSDSICSAIAYSNMLQRLGQEAVPCRQGPLNEETKFILKKFHQENPLLLTDARAMLKDIELDQPTTILPDETVHHAWHVMLQTQNRSLFVTDREGNLCGICTTSNLSRVRIHPDADLQQLMSTATLENIARTVGGKILVSPKDFSTNGAVHVITLDENEASILNLSGGTAIMSSSEEKQKMLIEKGVKCLVITCGQPVTDAVTALADEKGCAVIRTDHDTMHTARVITESYSVSEIMTTEIMSFKNTEYVEDVAQKMANLRVRSFPVVDEDGNVVGAVSRYHTRNYAKRKFVLVDHSARNQSINNIDKADIIAIVDHHHIGDVQTSMPIDYYNRRVGCTCTIIADLFQQNGMLPDEDMSGILLSAILSDTLNLKSATTTDKDRLTVKWLAERANIPDVDEYAKDMLGASVALKDSTPEEILNRDVKSYSIGKYNFSIGQTNYSRPEEVQQIIPEIKEALEASQQKNRLDLSVMLFTDVMGGGSFFVYYGPLSYVMDDLIETKFDEHSGFDPTIISRKQQMMPRLSKIIETI